MKKHKAVIFDLNGVIINDERIHQESWRQLCKKYNLNLTEEEFKQKVFGRTEADVLEYLFHRKLNEDEINKYSAERVKIAMNIFRPKMALTTGLKNFLDDLQSNIVPVAIATSSRVPYTNFILDGLEIRKYFSIVVTAEEIEKGKPDPEIYLSASKKLMADPNACVVFEDSVSGIKSGKAAGMYVVAITTTHGEDELLMADKIINSFNEVSAANLNLI